MHHLVASGGSWWILSDNSGKDGEPQHQSSSSELITSVFSEVISLIRSMAGLTDPRSVDPMRQQVKNTKGESTITRIDRK